ncbi:MAG: hypothetical protein IJU19_06775 [Bacteroidales bacterium]|nr:hypothetical protein [Bacteroidales bacterium]
MPTTHKHKKNLIVSYKNLTDELKELFKEAYPDGHSDYITKFIKPNGEAIYVVPFETSDTAYMVKFDMKIDTLGEDLDKALFDDDSESEGKDEEFAPLSEAIDKEEEHISHNEKHLRHGDFEDTLSNEEKRKAPLDIDKEGLKEAFGDDDDDLEDLDNDSYSSDDDLEDTDDFEPSDDDLRGIESEFGNVSIDAPEPIPAKGGKKTPNTTSTKPAPTSKNTTPKVTSAPKTSATKNTTPKAVAAPMTSSPKTTVAPKSTPSKPTATPKTSASKTTATPKASASPKPTSTKAPSSPKSSPTKPATKATTTPSKTAPKSTEKKTTTKSKQSKK